MRPKLPGAWLRRALALLLAAMAGAGLAQPPAQPDGGAGVAPQLRSDFAAIEGLDEIQVEASAGVVTLSGRVLEEEDRELALTLAREAEGVVSVRDRMELETGVLARLRPALGQGMAKLQRLLATAPLLLVAAAIVALAAWLGGWLSRRKRLFGRLAGNPFLLGLVRQVVFLAVLLVGVLVALDLLDATALVGAVLGAAGVVGIALGFAFKDLIENYVASVLLSLRQPFAPRDHVVVDGQEGKVVALNSRATILMTLDGNHLRLPNAQVFKAVILNYSRNPLRRFQIEVGVGVGEDLVEAQRIGTAVLRDIPGVLADPAPAARIDKLGDSSVLMLYFGWVDQRQADWFKVRTEAIRLVKTALERAGMDLPEPIYRVQLSRRPAGSAAATPAADQPPAEAGDVSVEDSVDAQIEAERPEHRETDLLDPAAPRE